MFEEMTIDEKSSVRVVSKQVLPEGLRRLDLNAGAGWSDFQPGHYAMASLSEDGPLMPLDIVEIDDRRGRIAVLLNESRPSHGSWLKLGVGDIVPVWSGPCGRPLLWPEEGDVLCCGSGSGNAVMVPVCRALKERGLRVTGLWGSSRRTGMLMEAQLRLSCREMVVMSPDGAGTSRGSVESRLDAVLVEKNWAAVYAAGPAALVRKMAEKARQAGRVCYIRLPFEALCVTGQCGVCRVPTRRGWRLSCQEGPFWPADEVQWTVWQENRCVSREPAAIEEAAAVSSGQQPPFWQRWIQRGERNA